MNSIIQMIALAGIRAECRVTDFTLCYGQSSRALQRQSRRCLLGHPGRWLHHAWLHASWDVSRCDAVACWLSAYHTSHESAYKGAVGRREAISFVTAPLWLSQPPESQPALNGQWLQHRAGVMMTSALPSFLPWCFLNVCQEHHSQQTHVSAPVITFWETAACLFLLVCLSAESGFLDTGGKKPQNTAFHSMVILI